MQLVTTLIPDDHIITWMTPVSPSLSPTSSCSLMTLMVTSPAMAQALSPTSQVHWPESDCRAPCTTREHS